MCAASSLPRRRILAGTAALLVLPACTTTGLGGLPNLAGVLKDLLGISAERAFARLAAPDGFMGDELVRLGLPDELAGGVAAALLSTPAIRDRLLQQINGAASLAARTAEPIVADAISDLSFADANAVLRGGPTAATDVLRTRIAGSLSERLTDSVTQGLRIGDAEIVTRIVSAVSGFDLNAMSARVSDAATGSIFRAIGREEAAIREDPSSTNNPALIAALLALG